MTPALALGPTIRRHRSEQVVATPWSFIHAVEKKFGPIAVDLAATEDNAKAGRFITPELDTFSQDWTKWLKGGLGWLNPEFDPINRWVALCAQQRARGAKFLTLMPASVGANWYWDYVEPFATVYSIGRITFEGSISPYPKDLLLAYYCLYPDRIMRRWRWKGELT